MDSKYDRMFQLFQAEVNGNWCGGNVMRKKLSHMLHFFNMFERERCAVQQLKLLKESQIQWFYWTVDDDSAGEGKWREFTLPVEQLKRAVENNETSVGLTDEDQHVYLIDFNEMTKRLLPDQHGFNPLHLSVPIVAKANLRNNFDIDKFLQIENELRTGTEQHKTFIKRILKIINSSMLRPLDKELANNALTLLLRLVSLDGMAHEFMKHGGVKEILQFALEPAEISPTLNTLATLILRQCIDSDKTILQSAFEQMIVATCNGQPISMQELTLRRQAEQTNQKDLQRVVRALAPLAVKSPALYIEMAKKCMVVKQNEIQRSDSINGNAAVSDQIISTVLQEVIAEMTQFRILSYCRKQVRLLQPSNLLKLIAELLRSYHSMAVPIFVNQTVEGQSVLCWLIDRFLLSAPVNTLSDTAHLAKTVVSELVSNSTSQRVTDHVIGDIKSLLNGTDGLDSNVTMTTVQRSNASAKLAARVTILANLTIHLKDCVLASSQFNARQSGFFFKSIHQKDLANDFVKYIWKIPLHEKPGVDMVNTLLRLLEGVIPKNGGSFDAMRLSTENRPLPCFIDRIADWDRIVEGQTMFIKGAVISSYIITAMQAATDEQQQQAEQPNEALPEGIDQKPKEYA